MIPELPITFAARSSSFRLLVRESTEEGHLAGARFPLGQFPVRGRPEESIRSPISDSRISKSSLVRFLPGADLTKGVILIAILIVYVSGNTIVKRLFILALSVTINLPAFAGEADVLNVDLSCHSESVCRFDVTVKHEDQGWEHYADKWEVLSPDGEILAARELAHPHENEQPFTRSLENVRIPSHLKAVIVRAHDSVHGYGGKEIVVKLSTP